MRKGYTLAETLIVVGIIVVLAVISTVSFVNRRNETSLAATASAMSSLLREAQGRSVAQASSTSWGVHFENSTTTRPFFALFSGAYSSSSYASYYPLPTFVGYVTSSVNIGSYAEVTFSQISGARNGSSSITIYLLDSGKQASTTLAISGAGAVSY